MMLKAMKEYKVGKVMETAHQGGMCDFVWSSDHI